MTLMTSAGASSPAAPVDVGPDRVEVGGESSRVMVVWCPDWPVVAVAAEQNFAANTPLAVVEHGEVYACSGAARDEGVKRGMRRRDATARCPELIVVDRVEDRELQTFEAVLSAVEEVSAGV